MELFLMGYRLLLKRYMAHVEASSGEAWLYPEQQDCDLSRRDLVELRRLCDELRRDDLLSNTREQNFNVIARNVCAQLKLDATSVAEKLAWPQHLIERWLLEPGHSDYKAMTPGTSSTSALAFDSITTNTTRLTRPPVDLLNDVIVM